ncbi:nuclear factor interleukin-3-regulated protein-like, partial [Ornithorhynchus anatinus]|uniref:nuclear factor interleukin-3-regulated protein-like n=1 Tax=Ornithorhynchus anatinus TaxID=9258 RepID=UPI0019D44D24
PLPPPPPPPPSSSPSSSSRRRRREFTPEEKKDAQYWEKRRRNNEAAKRSREKRRLNDLVLESRLVALGRENAALRAELLALKARFGLLPPPPVKLEPPEAGSPRGSEADEAGGGKTPSDGEDEQRVPKGPGPAAPAALPHKLRLKVRGAAPLKREGSEADLPPPFALQVTRLQAWGLWPPPAPDGGGLSDRGAALRGLGGGRAVAASDSG